jgi:hypothetical protein
MLPAVNNQSPSGEVRWRCSCNLHKISIALIEYYHANKAWPPAYIADKNGRPMHSWRVLILPYLELDSLYKKYDFNEPWDGPNNRKLLAERPDVYACPSRREVLNGKTAATNYVAVVGAHAAWQPDNGVDFNNPALKNQFSDTVVLMEDASGIAWTEPRDCSLDAIEAAADKNKTIRTPHMYSCDYFYRPCPTGANVLLLDGSTAYWRSQIFRLDDLKQRLAIGGNKMDDIKHLALDEPVELHVPHCIQFVVSLVVWIISVFLLLCRAWRSREKEPQITGNPQE